MKARDVQIGRLYLVKVSGALCTVRITAIEDRWHPFSDRKTTIYRGVNLKTGRDVTCKSAQRLRCEVTRDGDREIR